MSTRKRTAILISGRGTNMAALIEVAGDPTYPAQIVGVISNRADATGLAIAENAGIDTAVVGKAEHGTPEAADAAITARLEAWNAEIVCLAGFMRILTPGFCARWHGRLINIHPSLLPEFPGLDPHERAIAAGVTEHGCTVHFVTAETDAGPIIGQVRVPVEFGDTAADLAARVLKAEHKLYPWALAEVATGAIAIDA